MPADPPSIPIPRCLLGLRPPLTEWVPRPIQKGRGLQNCGEGTQRDNPGRTVRFRRCRGKFSRLTHLPPSDPCRHQRWTPLAPPERLSNKPFRNCQQSYHTGIKGLVRPSGSPKCQEEKAQLKAGVRQVAAVAGLPGRSARAGTFTTIYSRLQPKHSVISSSNSKPSVASLSWHHLFISQRLQSLEIQVLPSSWSVVTGETLRLLP